MANDIVIPIVFPDYLIAVNTPPVKIKVPDLLPFIDVFPDVIRIPATKNKVPELGHAGVLFINGATGLTKYYEYGRYDRAALGLTRRVPMPDVKIKGGRVDQASLANVLAQISRQTGQGGRISGAYIEVPGQFQAMLRYAQSRVAMNRNPRRKPYDLTSNSCVHFMRAVVDSAGVDTPWMFDPRPTSYIEELRDDQPNLDYKPADHALQIQ